jgi:bidirectional [NiFe] hydrogenase diaphorase subunit
MLPDESKRWKIVEATMRRNGFRGDALIETLHTVQSVFGFLDKPALLFVANALNVAPSRVHGVATFYHFFQLRPQGARLCSICTGTACHIKGSQELLGYVKENFGLKPGETTPDGELSLATVRCIGACGLAPAIVVDGEVLGTASVEALDRRLKGVAES